jgi:uncharacterized protein (DUF2236 family)
VHADIAMIVGGLRALLLQTLHPLAMAGVADHSDFRRHPLRRLHRTSHFIGTTTFGSTAQAEAALAAVRAVHRHVVGIAPDGRPYDAADPHLVKWVHITEVDSFLAAYTRYGGTRLSASDRDRYVAEMAEIARRLGAEDDVPTDAASLRAALDAFRPELHVSRQTSEAVRFLLVPPLPTLARAPYGVVTAAAVDLLPPWARRMLWLPAPPLTTRVVVRPAATAMLATLRWALAAPIEEVA